MGFGVYFDGDLCNIDDCDDCSFKKRTFDLTFWQRVKVIAFNPIFLLSYVWCAVKALLVKDVKWKRLSTGRGEVLLLIFLKSVIK